MKKYIALVLVAVLVLGIFTGCGNKGNKETESQTDEKATESVNSAENNTEDSTQSSTEISTENQNVADTEQLTTENGQESSVLACPSVTVSCMWRAASSLIKITTRCSFAESAHTVLRGIHSM